MRLAIYTRTFNLSALLVVICLYAGAQGKARFVSPGGEQQGNGLSIDHPLHSITSAIRLSAPGDTVYLIPGIYREMIKIEDVHGLPENPIHICGYPSDSLPMIDGGAPRPSMDVTWNWIECRNASWITFNGIGFRNGWTDPIRLEASSWISFQNCYFYGGRKVILATGAETHHVLVEYCHWDQGGERLWTIDKDSLGVDAWLSMHHQLMGYYNGSLVDSRASGGSFVIRHNYIQNAYNGIRFTSKKGFDANAEIY
ncbi:MAG: hypothetical protein JST39_08480, partial [Bacteroidetes bacterium]|nr:hypothetical protein [Bacteroidota bacterium]